ncbi:MAG TPA: PQQ-dependent dehydrogenase, methanol/ethanol family [Steroidobacteraceae bacterium]|nr:PQQ-dependent dehydrogenase, methanol/ethanol family [Steroidobacteraceae bacterium]
MALLLAACGQASDTKPIAVTAQPELPRRFAAVDDKRLLAADENPGQWMSHGRTYGEQRFSPLTKINIGNVATLGLAWYGDFDTRRGQESTPIIVDGAIYVTTAWSKVYAYDAKTGKPLWKYDPQVPGEWGVNACCDVVNRGVAAWNGNVYLGTLDGRLVALDAGTGEVVWQVQTTDKNKAYSITGAPRIAKGKVFIGQAGAEFSQRGYISAYDAETGKLDWRWYIVPGNPKDGFENKQMELAAKTWGGEWWKTGGGGSPWDAIVYDPTTDNILIGTGNGAPWPAEIRSPGNNDNLYLASIVALKADTGEYAWHYQMTPHESWDYDGTQQITVADLEIHGKKRHVAMQASKNGHFYVLDAGTGELLSAKAFIPGVNWTSGINLETGRPNFNPKARYDRTNKGFIVVPTPGGAHSWHPMSFDPQTGLVYIPAMYGNYPMVATHEDDNPIGQKLSISMTKGFAMYDQPGAPKRANGGFLLAWDPVNQKEVWRVSFENGRGGGTLSTAGGLVFQGNSKNQEFAAYRADNGEKLWSMPTQAGIVAGAASYEVDGEQFVAVAAGARLGGNYYAPNHSRLLVFRLGGTAQLPPANEAPPQVLNPPEAFGTPEVVKHGAETYNRFCGTCHGTDGQSRGMFPDLRYSATLNSADVFHSIVIDGALTANGMVSFKKALTEEDVNSIRAYIVSRAIDAKKNGPGGMAAMQAQRSGTAASR